MAIMSVFFARLAQPPARAIGGMATAISAPLPYCKLTAGWLIAAMRQKQSA